MDEVVDTIVNWSIRKNVQIFGSTWSNLRVQGTFGQWLLGQFNLDIDSTTNPA